MADDWITLVQVLVWPVFLTILLIALRHQVVNILSTIRERIEAGAEVKIGTFSLGSGPKLTRLNKDEGHAIPTSSRAGESPSPFQDLVYMVHSATKPRIDADGVERRGIRVILDADSDEILNKVERVVYHLHPTFPNPNREVTDAKSKFELLTRAWGEFNLTADVYFAGNATPLKLYRYLNF